MVPIWQLNDCHKIASLEGFQAVSKKLKEAQDFLLQDEAAAEFAIPVFMAMNRQAQSTRPAHDGAHLLSHNL